MARTDVPQNLRLFATDANSLGLGATREAYDLGDGTVLKVDWNAGGTLGGCATEVAYWEAASPAAREFLAPILAHGDGWLVMPYCAPVDQITFLAFDAAADAAGVLIGDLNPCGVGRMADGRVVCCDYAADNGEGCGGCGWCDTCEQDYAARLAATA